ncbi:MAG TPA: terminase [Bacillus bacterium]|uniref:phage terminase small subunit n=1 Tax=Siminovitchia fordii TaxID=254759 RepID=UPI0003658E9F|nr:phage terminase small subunit [Siminovitchia fordii]HBZ09131.1 terminase [Bacillus sp. (in: firmicutes)]
MARPRDPRRDKAKKIWLDSGKQMKLVDIAEKLGVSASTVRKWKSQDKWDTDSKGSAPISKGSAPKRSGAPTGNQNAKGNRGGGAPKGNQNARGNPGGRPPSGNKNAVTTGEYETIMWEYLDDDEKELFEAIETDPLYQIDITIRELSIRQRRMMKRIKQRENGLTEKESRILKEMRTVKEIIEVHDDNTGNSKKVPIHKDKLVTVEVEETEFRKIDDILNIEEALTRITNQLVKAIKQKHDIEKSYGEQPLKLSLIQSNIDKLNAEIANISNDNSNSSADDWVTALKEVAEKRKVKRNEQ